MSVRLPSPLVDVGWLAPRLGESQLLVVDATVFATNGGYVTGHEMYVLGGHLPGAVFADLIDDFSAAKAPFPFTRPDADRFSAAASALGIGASTAVVIYDAEQGQWASRLWWLLRSFGHDHAAVLDGGLTAWRARNRSLDLGHVEPHPAHFVARPRPELWADQAEVAAVSAGRRAGTLLCAAAAKEFSGEVSPRRRAGHIPGSLSVPLSRLVDRESREFFDPSVLQAALAPTSNGRVISYCSGGISASAAAFAMMLVDSEREVAVYDGSLIEWSADPQLPLVQLVPGPPDPAF